MLLALFDWNFDVIPADVDETVLEGEPPKEYVLRLAEEKARAVSATLAETALVISADTTVVDQGEILGKPVDAEDAESMLRQLRGGCHQVYTGIAVFKTDGDLLTDLGATDVPMRNYTDEEVQAYIDSGDPLDKAGAYAIQHAGFHPVESLKGCYANVVGLPLCHLLRTLRKLDLDSAADVPAQCQTTLGYQCPIYEKILQEEL